MVPFPINPDRNAMTLRILLQKSGWILLVVLLSSLAACSRGGPAPQATLPEQQPEPSVAAQITATPEPPTATPEPLAARANNQGISLADYQAELVRYQAATGSELTEDDRQRVLDELVDQLLLAQAATEQGFNVDDAALDTRLAQLTGQMGGEQALAAWLAANSYDLASFRQALRRSMAAAWMRDQIVQAVPATADQVHARQILFDNPDEANQVIAQLDGGADFAQLAAQYDPATRGELGWFPRGYLLDPAIDEAVFKLEAGQHTAVLQSQVGYHIIQVVERSADRSLAPDALLAVQTQALREWINEQRASSQIEYLAP